MLDIKKKFYFNENEVCSWFEANIDWIGENIDITLAGVDEDKLDSDTVNKAFEVLQKVYSNQKEWDEKLRWFAAKELTEDFNSSEIESTKITEEKFAKRIEIIGIVMYPSNDFFTVFCYYNSTSYECSIQLIVNISGECEHSIMSMYYI